MLLITQWGVCGVTVQDCSLLVSVGETSTLGTHYLCYKAMFVIFDILSLVFECLRVWVESTLLRLEYGVSGVP